MGTGALVLPLDDPGADLDVVGGKGASLARLRRAGLPVPDGFHVTTHAYRAFTAGLGVGRPDAASVAAGEVPAEVAAAILAALPAGPVAVRSSATAEDLPDLSFAGQHDTVLDVRGRDVLDAVRRCWASLWTERAVAYRARHGVADAAMAVVVQEMVPADAAGVLFTADPVTGARDRTVVEAAPGPGDALVGGEVAPERYAVVDGAVTSGGDLLDDREVLELAALGARAQELVGAPVDVEWARGGGRFALLQARPITALEEVWNDSLRGDYLWTCANLGEAVPSVMTPATWSVAQVLAQPPIGGHPTAGNIGGRFYLNLSAVLAVGSALGLGGPARRLAAEVFGHLPDGVRVPALPMSRPATVRAALAALAPFLRQQREYARRVEGLLAAAPARAGRLRDRIADADTPARLLALWVSEVEVFLRDDIRVYDAGARAGARGGGARLRRTLRRLVGERDAAALLTGAHGPAGELAGLGPLLALARLRRGEIDRETYLREWGHRFADEFELSAPRPAEDPDWLDRQAAVDGPDPAELLAGQAAAREAAWRRLVAAHPRGAARLGRALAAHGAAVRLRERARSEMVRGFGVLRAFLVRARELTGHDVFFLSLAETAAVLGGDPGPVSAIPARRRAYERYRALPPYPTVIRGHFDPVSWAADPDRRGDVHAPAAAPPGREVTGLPGAAGVAEGVVRVIPSVADGAALRPGEVLVTTVTNIGWTPLFPRAAAVVTDVGAPLSHAAIVARELGIPAVVGCGDATARLRTGDRVRVDGARGTVTPVDRAG